MTDEEVEEIFVLYGSQTGNSEQAAKDFCSLVDRKLNRPGAIQELLSRRSSVDGDGDGGSAAAAAAAAAAASANLPKFKPVHMQLDDFLEMRRCGWTRLVVIFVSSYGVGQAPLGCYRFRDLCDAWLEDTDGGGGGGADSSSRPLEGISYAMCGLGDSKYTTFFKNPSTIDRALTAAGACRVGPLGRADASGEIGTDQEQARVIEDWIDGIWPHVAQVLASEWKPTSERMAEIQNSTIGTCKRINPEFLDDDDDENEGGKKTLPTNVLVPLMVAAVAAIVYYYSQS